MDKSTCLEVKGLSKWFGGLAANLDIDFSVEEGRSSVSSDPTVRENRRSSTASPGFITEQRQGVLFREDITKFRADKVCNLGIARTFQIVQVISDMTVLENVVTGALLRYTRIGPATEKRKNPDVHRAH